MIGNAEHAATIATMPLAEDEFADWIGPVPDGFRYLGSGAYRHAFLGPDNVVYKRDVHDYTEDEGGNLSEWATYCDESKVLPEGVRLAVTALYGTIIAMEYIPTKSPMLPAETRHKIINMGVWDCYGNNVRVKDGMVVLTDFAM